MRFLLVVACLAVAVGAFNDCGLGTTSNKGIGQTVGCQTTPVVRPCYMTSPTTTACGPCPAGYQASNATHCVNINECLTSNGGCHSLTTCTDTQGSRTCGSCPAGYTGTGATRCIDIDECKTNNGGCHFLQNCTNTLGSFACGSCPTGYTKTGALGNNCTDIDECFGTNDKVVCPIAGTQCVNYPGTYDCHCVLSTTLLHSGSQTGGNCNNAAKCVWNLARTACFASGTATCDGWRTGSSTTGGTCTGACPAGRSCGACAAGTACTDINECLPTPGLCPSPTNRSAGCLNTVQGGSNGNSLTPPRPGYDCKNCLAGFTDPNTCRDINECTLVSNGGCDPQSTCTNSPIGRYACSACASSYMGTGATNCSRPNLCYKASHNGLQACDSLSTCQATGIKDNFNCTACPSGFTGTGATACTDVNECASNNGGCDRSVSCTNTAGSRLCGICPAGKAGSGYSACTNCTAGQYADTSGLTACKLCADGKFESQVGRSACRTCQVGRFTASRGAADCLLCPAGTFGSGSNFTSQTKQCVQCPFAQYTASAGLTICTACAGFRANTTSKGSGSASACLCLPGYSGTGSTLCARCAIGRFKTALADGACTACTAHSNTTGTGATTSGACQCVAGYAGTGASSSCTACSVGKYKTASTDGSCSTCPVHANTTGTANVAAAACLCAPGYSGTGSVACTPCTYGQYKSSLANGACSACPAHTNTTATGSTAQSLCLCLAGYSGIGSASSCSRCDYNRFKANLANGGCSACPAHTNTTATGSTALSACKCKPGFAGIGAVNCSRCDYGQYEPLLQDGTCVHCANHANTTGAGSTAASACLCLPGYSGTGSSSCARCDYDQFKSSLANGACSACPAHTNTTATGSTTSAACLCLPGYSGTGSTSCARCDYARYKSNLANGACTACASHANTTATGSTTVLACQCLPGFAGTGSVSCTRCDYGQFKSNLVNGGCSSCPAHANTTGTGSTAISGCLCLPGYSGSGSASCTRCGYAQYKTALGDGACTACAANANTTATGSTSPGACACNPKYAGVPTVSCQLCVAGKFVGTSSCVACALGKFSNATGASVCSTCPFGTYANTTLSTSCRSCAVGYTVNATRGCKDINECLANNGGCSRTPFSVSTCTNTPGSRTCGPCATGFTGSGVGNCTDVNECLSRNGGCSLTSGSVAVCTDTPGSRTCGPCAAGFSGSGVNNCTDVNECLVNNGGCSSAQHQICVNLPGSFTCKCSAGRGGFPNCCPLLPVRQGQPSNAWTLCGGRGTCPSTDGHCQWSANLADAYGCPIATGQASSCGIYGSCEQWGNCTCGLGVFVNISGSACQRNTNCDYAGVSDCNMAGDCRSVATDAGCFPQLHFDQAGPNNFTWPDTPHGYAWDSGLAGLLRRLHNAFISFNPRQTDQPFTSFAAYNATYAAPFATCMRVAGATRAICLGQALVRFGTSSPYQNVEESYDGNFGTLINMQFAAAYPGRISLAPAVLSGLAALLTAYDDQVVQSLAGIGPVTADVEVIATLLCYEALVLDVNDPTQNTRPTATLNLNSDLDESFSCVCSSPLAGQANGIGGPQCRFTCPVGANGQVCSGIDNGVFHGSCASQGACLCDLHWAGSACDHSVRGECYDDINPKTCSFDKTGASCTLSSNRYHCVCPAAWVGAFCEYSACALANATDSQRRIQCHGLGTCDGSTRLCDCDTGTALGGPRLNTTLPFPSLPAGDDCERNGFAQCAWFVHANASTAYGTWTECNRHGECVANATHPNLACSCFEGFFGDRCQFTACEPACNAHQACDVTHGLCKCAPFWQTAPSCTAGNRICECGQGLCGHGTPSEFGTSCTCDDTWKKGVNGSCTEAVCPLTYLGAPLLGAVPCPPGKPVCSNGFAVGGDCCIDLCHHCTADPLTDARTCDCATLPAAILNSTFCTTPGVSCDNIDLGFHNVAGFCVGQCGGGHPVIAANHSTVIGCNCEPFPGVVMNRATQFYHRRDCSVTTCVNGGRANQTTETCNCGPSVVFGGPACALSLCGAQGTPAVVRGLPVCACNAPFTFPVNATGFRTSPFCTANTCGHGGQVVSSQTTLTGFECRCGDAINVLSADKLSCAPLDCAGIHAALCLQCALGAQTGVRVTNHAVECFEAWGDVRACPANSSFVIGIRQSYHRSARCQLCNATLDFHLQNPTVSSVGLPLYADGDRGDCNRTVHARPYCKQGWWHFSATVSLAEACTRPRRSTWCSSQGDVLYPTLYNDVAAVCRCDAGFSGARDLSTHPQGCWQPVRAGACSGHGNGSLGIQHLYWANDTVHCACDAGWTGGNCGTDINECLIRNGGCSLQPFSVSTCTNTPGSRTCGPCAAGFTGTGVGNCTNINECLTSNGGCDSLTSCTNTPGSRTCGSCPAGYSGSGSTSCVDVNECLTNNGGCASHSLCVNHPGNYSCGACDAGYSGTGDTTCTLVVHSSTGGSSSSSSTGGVAGQSSSTAAAAAESSSSSSSSSSTAVGGSSSSTAGRSSSSSSTAGSTESSSSTAAAATGQPPSGIGDQTPSQTRNAAIVGGVLAGFVLVGVISGAFVGSGAAAAATAAAGVAGSSATAEPVVFTSVTGRHEYKRVRFDG